MMTIWIAHNENSRILRQESLQRHDFSNFSALTLLLTDTSAISLQKIYNLSDYLASAANPSESGIMTAAVSFHCYHKFHESVHMP